MSLLGNTIVLISSRKHNALKLDQYSIRLIDNLAAADIGYTLTGTIPTISAIAAEGWIYGHHLCVADRYLTNVFYNITPLLVALLCVSKLTCIMFPLSVVTRDTKHVLLAVSAIWALVVTSCLISTLVYRDNIYYDHISYQCWVDYTHREYFGTFLIIYMILVAAVIITTTIWLIVLVRRLTGGTQTKGATAIIAVAAIYSLATVPTAAMMAVELTVWYESWSDDAKALVSTAKTPLLGDRKDHIS
ncbi:G-protein coupled receptor 83-like [Bolinopsis microptera]|uniref:G-protein coupled receptor 83-like n=1 Tax=Bolinopsis microptera TaxID=2820187 RepID=UPI00307AECF9